MCNMYFSRAHMRALPVASVTQLIYMVFCLLRTCYAPVASVTLHLKITLIIVILAFILKVNDHIGEPLRLCFISRFMRAVLIKHV